MTCGPERRRSTSTGVCEWRPGPVVLGRVAVGVRFATFAVGLVKRRLVSTSHARL